MFIDNAMRARVDCVCVYNRSAAIRCLSCLLVQLECRQSGNESAIGLVAGDGAKGTERIVQADRPLPLRVYTAKRRYDSKQSFTRVSKFRVSCIRVLAAIIVVYVFSCSNKVCYFFVYVFSCTNKCFYFSVYVFSCIDIYFIFLGIFRVFFRVLT